MVVIDLPARGLAVSSPGGLLAQCLASHDVNVEIDELAMALPHVSDLLMRHTTDIYADMLVMGDYGQNRFLQAIFGGNTRNILEQAKLAESPVSGQHSPVVSDSLNINAAVLRFSWRNFGFSHRATGNLQSRLATSHSPKKPAVSALVT